MERERLHLLAIGRLYRLVRYHLDRRQYDKGLAHAARLLALDPLDEPAHRQMMRLLAASGQRHAALAQYDLCCQALRQELGVLPETETTTLYQRLKTTPAGPPTGSRPPARPAHNPPRQHTPLVGRQTELGHLTAHLLDPAYRLLTLTGVGGVGKTRLALAAAEQVAPDFAQGVRLVALAGVGDQDESEAPASYSPISELDANPLILAVAQALGLTLTGYQPLETQVLDHLRDKELLLVLDNLEHLLEAGLAFVAQVLELAPAVSLLITSRQRLNLQAEYALRLEGLPVPSHTQDSAAAACSSVQLFCERAERAARGFVLDEQTAPAVNRICQLVDGLPLGIELAAAQVRLLPVPEIAQLIQRSPDHLATTLRDVPARHQSIRAVFARSWSLLTS